MRRITKTKLRKELFIQSILPLILQANDDILIDRKNAFGEQISRRIGSFLDLV